jgi:hypothetical protein
MSSDKPGSRAESAVSYKLSSDKLSLIACANEIAIPGHVGNDGGRAVHDRTVTPTRAHHGVLSGAKDDSTVDDSEPLRV